MKHKVSSKTIPLLIVMIGIIAFGMIIPSLGYYVDDWHHLYYGFMRGLDSLPELFLYDSRPLAAVFYYVAFSILDYAPIGWHLFSFGLRLLTVLFVWLALGAMWPDRKREVAWITLLFAVYPLFKLQPIAVAYSLHWFGYFCFAVSIWAMVQSIRNPERYWIYTLLSILTGCTHMFFIEYFAGIELIRPVILWMVIPDRMADAKARLRKVQKLWSPYLGIYITFLVYRFYLIPKPEPGFERNPPSMIIDLFSSPLATLPRLIQGIIQDLIEILISVWSNSINPEVFEITRSANIKSVLIALLVSIGLFIYLRNLKFESHENNSNGDKWINNALLLGILLTLLGPIPAWATDQFITTKHPFWSDRYGLAAMLGASIVVVALLEILISDLKYCLVVFCILIGFSLNWQILNANEYCWSWVKQTDFYHQLIWRAPYIEPKTAILSDGEIFSQMTENSTSFAISTLYPKVEDSMELPYWFFSLYRRFNEEREELIEGMPLEYSRFFYQFSGNSRDSLVIYYEPGKNQCLWLVRPEDHPIRELPEITREVASISNLDRIKKDPVNDRSLDGLIGKENTNQWCYYYQKADLARQFHEWENVIAIWEQASDKGHQPANGVEYLPFIEGYAWVGDWEKAGVMTMRANRLTRKMKPVFCSLWDQFEDSTSPSPEREETLSLISQKLDCK